MMRVHVFTHRKDKESAWTPRIEFDLDETNDAAALTKIGVELNRGDGRIGQLYRSHGFPPLGVGDLIVLDRVRWWICRVAGWESCDRPESVPDETPREYDPEARKVKRG